MATGRRLGSGWQIVHPVPLCTKRHTEEEQGLAEGIKHQARTLRQAIRR